MIHSKRRTEHHLSYDPFVDFLRSLLKNQEDILHKYIEDTISQFTELLKTLKNGQVDRPDTTKSLLGLMDRSLSFRLDQSDGSFNIYTTPAWDELTFINDRLPGILRTKEEQKSFITCLIEQLFHQHDLITSLRYKTIWNQMTDFPCPLATEYVIPYQSLQTGRFYYFRLCPDFKFIQVQPRLAINTCRQIIENIDAASLTAENTLNQLRKELPISNFRFKGIGRFIVTDVTIPHIIKLIDRQVESSDYYTKTFAYIKDVRDALGIISGSDSLHFGLLPMFELNGQFLFNEHISELDLSSNYDESSKKNLFEYLMNIYRLEPYRLYLSEIEDELTEKYEYLKVHKKNGIQSFALLPVFFHRRFVGVLEVVAKNKNDLSKITLGNLEAFIPVLGTLFNKCIENLKQNIDDVIKIKFTSLQPSVQWRFNEAAYRYLQYSEGETDQLEIEEISFNQVYPLYGAIDIKNSTIKRNEALRRDAICHLMMLNETLMRLKESTSFGLLDEKIADCKKWQELVSDDLAELPEGELNYFFENEIYSFFRDLTYGKPAIADITGGYFNALDDINGPASMNRHALENSINVVVGAVNDLVEELNHKAQQDFPCFFEKFRTDGVEYDIYAGQTIAPDRPFNHIFIKNLRYLQLTNMIAIANRTRQLQSQLEVTIEITQLIFVNPNFIDIRFRRDERRFDVEGAYNIRYHIVKKRIDKVLIKNSNERLTAPGKIAIVYTSQKEADEYMIHIRYLQAQNLLYPQTEILELEQLQGVVGLKALRVAICYQHS